MKLFKCAIPLVLIVFTFSSCSSSGGMKKNQLSVKKNAVTYYLGKYTGNEKDCFPPITNRICSLQSSYEIIQQLDMELFTFELQGPSDISDEPLYLAASELALQRGYASFTVLGGSNFSSCVSLGTQAKTYGNYTPNLTGGGRYSGTTRIQSSGTVFSNRKMRLKSMRMFFDYAAC